MHAANDQSAKRAHFAELVRLSARMGFAKDAERPSFAADELEVIRAADAFKARTGKRSLTAADYLAIARSLGYRKQSREERPHA